MNVNLPTLILNILSPFSQLFSSPTWKKAQFLCIGAILCQGARRISSILHIMGMANNKGFEKYHRFLNRDQWNPLVAARILFGLLVSLIPPNQILIIVFDDTVERRKGRTIKAKGCYRDAVSSTRSHVVTFKVNVPVLACNVTLEHAPLGLTIPHISPVPQEI